MCVNRCPISHTARKGAEFCVAAWVLESWPRIRDPIVRNRGQQARSASTVSEHGQNAGSECRIRMQGQDPLPRRRRVDAWTRSEVRKHRRQPEWHGETPPSSDAVTDLTRVVLVVANRSSMPMREGRIINCGRMSFRPAVQAIRREPGSCFEPPRFYHDGSSEYLALQLDKILGHLRTCRTLVWKD